MRQEERSYLNRSLFPEKGEDFIIYIDVQNDLKYRWSLDRYVLVSTPSMQKSSTIIGGAFDRESLFDILSNEPQNGEYINLRYLDLSNYATTDFVVSQGYITKTFADSTYASLAAFNILNTKVTNFLSNEADVDETINRWKELESFLAGYTETATLADLLSVKADKTTVEQLQTNLDNQYSKLSNYFDSEGNAKNALKLEGKALDELFTSLSSNTENVISITIGGVTQGISQKVMRTALGLGTAAYKAEEYFATSEDLSETNVDVANLTSNLETANGSIAILQEKVAEFESWGFELKTLSDGSRVLITPHNFASEGEVTAGSEGESSGGSSGGASTLGELLNVNSDVDNTQSEDVVLIKYANASHWAMRRLADMVGLDTEALAEYLITNKYAQESYVQEKINDLINGAPTTLDTLKEIADAITANKTIVDALDAAIGNKLDKSQVNELFTALLSNTTTPISITVGGVTKTISQEVLRKSLGLGTAAYKTEEHFATSQELGETNSDLAQQNSIITTLTESLERANNLISEMQEKIAIFEDWGFRLGTLSDGSRVLITPHNFASEGEVTANGTEANDEFEQRIVVLPESEYERLVEEGNINETKVYYVY